MPSMSGISSFEAFASDIIYYVILGVAGFDHSSPPDVGVHVVKPCHP